MKNIQFWQRLKSEQEQKEYAEWKEKLEQKAQVPASNPYAEPPQQAPKDDV